MWTGHPDEGVPTNTPVLRADAFLFCLTNFLLLELAL